MNGAQFRAERVAHAMTGAQFGAYLADKLGRQRAYDRREISAWETGSVPLPEAVERVILRLRLLQVGGAPVYTPVKSPAKSNVPE